MINVKRGREYFHKAPLIDFSRVRLSETTPWWTLEILHWTAANRPLFTHYRSIVPMIENWILSLSRRRYICRIVLSWSDIIYLILISSCRLDHYPAEESQLAWTNLWPLFHQMKRRTLSKTITIIITWMRKKAFLTWLCRSFARFSSYREEKSLIDTKRHATNDHFICPGY